MTDETQGAAPADAEDTAAVLALASGEKTYLGEPAEETPPPGDEAAAAAEPGEGDKPKPKPTAQERFDELTRARREAEREAEFWKAKATQAPTDAKPATEAPKDEEPDPAEFQYGETDPGYIKALGAHSARQEFARLSQEAERKTAARSVNQTWDQRQAEFAKTKPDYYEALGKEWDCSEPMADAIRTSEDGAAVAYHLANNPAEARRIAALNPLAAIREIGKLEARLAAPPADTPTPIKTVSDAPTPGPELRGQGGKFKVAGDTQDFAAFEKTYLAN